MNGDNTLSGTVTDDNDSPLAGVAVSAVQNGEDAGGATTGSDGTYSMSVDPTMEAVVTFRLGGYVTYVANADAGATSLDATLQRA
ncbi:MAG TPA: carboxypeptidase-like regulatory domain-containing protein [Thermoanaerobaculia bacterium]|nr:carboxypeptidase-like regulatory domain-containing protein [Thermoanaerobaculia bacterium]